MPDNLIWKSGDRTEFCHNCRYENSPKRRKPCNDCFGNEVSGELYCYKNWKKQTPKQMKEANRSIIK